MQLLRSVPPSHLAAHGRADVGGYLCRAAAPGRVHHWMRAIGQAERALEAETNGLDAALTLIDEGMGVLLGNQ